MEFLKDRGCVFQTGVQEPRSTFILILVMNNCKIIKQICVLSKFGHSFQ